MNTIKERPILFSGPMVRAILDGKKTQTRRVMRVQPSEEFHPSSMVADWDYLMMIDRHGEEYAGDAVFGVADEDEGFTCSYGAKGDRLWVRETWQTHSDLDHVKPSDLRSGVHVQYPATYDHWDSKKRPSIFMPRWASRLTLEITNVRVERLNEISEEDAKAEGCRAIDAEQWYIGLKPLADGTYAEQESRGLPPSSWKNVRPIGDFDKDLNVVPHTYDPMARKAKDEFAALWNRINGKTHPWESNPWVWVIEFKQV